jgi:hypothetical protein
MPVILVTEEAEIRRIVVQRAWANSSGDFILGGKKKGWWRGSRYRPSTAKKKKRPITYIYFSIYSINICAMFTMCQVLFLAICKY